MVNEDLDQIEVKVSYESDKVKRLTNEEFSYYVEKELEKFESDGYVVTSMELKVYENDYIDVKVNRHSHEPFERIRRITGYLVGTLRHFNNAKREEVRARVKHSTKGLEDYE